MMKVTLLYLDNIVEQRPVSNYPHMDIIASMLSNDYIVTSLYNNTQKEVLEHVLEKKPEYIGLLINTTEYINETINFINLIRSESPNSILIAYGVYCTFWSQFLSTTHKGLVDYIIIGEPEINFYNIITTSKGKTNETQIINEVKVKNLDDLPIQAMHSKTDLNTMISRGCFNNCLFCCEKPFYGYYRYRSVENVILEIKNFYDENIDQWIYFSDLDFLAIDSVDKKWFDFFITRINEENINIKFTFQTRVNRIINGQELLMKLFDIGLRGVSLGIESGSKRVLNIFNKNSEGPMNREAINILKKLKIPFKINYIMFEPTSTMNDVKENIEFLKSVKFPEGTYISQPPASASSKLRIILNSQAFFHYFSDSKNSLRIDNGYLRYDFEDEDVTKYCAKIELWRNDSSRFFAFYSYCQNYILNCGIEDLRLSIIGNRFKKIDLEVLDLLIDFDYSNIKIINYIDQTDDLLCRLEKWASNYEDLDNEGIKLRPRGWHVNSEYLFKANI
ncbi:MAG TPA: radical SAM protein [Sedimentibacter sp.]|nr:radical SAM protein [Sedimentibacter sp.]